MNEISTAAFWTAQVLAVTATVILLVYSLMHVSRKTILICNIIINLLNAVHYLLMQSYSGAVCSLLCTGMVFAFYFKDKWRYRYLIPSLFGLSFIVFGLLTWQNGWSVIPIIGHLILTCAFLNDRPIMIKAMFIAVAFLWMVYNFVLGSWMFLAGQTLSFLFNLYYVIRFRKNGLTE